MSAAQSNCTQPSAHPFRKPASSALSADSRFMFQPVGSRPPIKRPIGPNSSVVRPDNPSLSTLRPMAPSRNFSSPPLSSAQRRMTPVGPGHSGGYGPVTRPTWPPANGYPGRNGPLGSAGPQHNPQVYLLRRNQNWSQRSFYGTWLNTILCNSYKERVGYCRLYDSRFRTVDAPASLVGFLGFNADTVKMIKTELQWTRHIRYTVQ